MTSQITGLYDIVIMIKGFFKLASGDTFTKCLLGTFKTFIGYNIIIMNNVNGSSKLFNAMMLRIITYSVDFFQTQYQRNLI